MVSLPSLGGGVGFRAAFKLSFAAVVQPLFPNTPAPPPLPIPTIVPISTDFFEADVTVTMDATEASNTFDICVYGMGDDIYSLLTVQKTIVHITLGYDDGDTAEVMTGLLTEKSLQAGDQWYEATLKGVDFVFDQLQRPAALVADDFQGQTVGDIASAICQKIGIDTQIPDKGPTLETRTFTDATPFAALNTLAGIAGFTLQAKDGKAFKETEDKKEAVLQPDSFVRIENKVSVWWQVFAYLVITIAEVLISVTGLELAYTAAPKSMTGFVTACWLLTVGMANLLINAPVTRRYTTMQPMAYFAMLAFVLLLVMVAFIFVARRFNRFIEEKPHLPPIDTTRAPQTGSDGSEGVTDPHRTQ